MSFPRTPATFLFVTLFALGGIALADVIHGTNNSETLTGTNQDDEIHGYFYHLRTSGDPPQEWRHLDRYSTPEIGPIPFDLSWVPLAEVPRLAANQGAFLSAIGGTEVDLGRTVRLPMARRDQ